MTLLRRPSITALAAVAMLAGPALGLAQQPATQVKKADIDKAVTRGVDYLKTKGQAADGSYSAQMGPAITAIVTCSVLEQGRSPDSPQVAKSLKYLEGFVQDDGGIYAQGSRLPNYETCIALKCFADANKDGRYKKLIASAEKYIKGLQWDPSSGQQPSDINYGGVGYGGNSRPDLSNTASFLEALESAGDGADDEAVKRALVFVSRCQNLESEDNTTPFAAKDPDGGFFYTPAAGGGSPAGTTDEGGLRSYGSMTYAGLKSMIYAGVKPDDKRVQAAVKWLADHYTLEENPGMGQAGVFYYYHVMAKSLDAMKDNTIADSAGKKHDWRQELAAELIKRQRDDGSWVNDNKKWMEGDANLSTAFALLSLAYCQPSKP